MPHLDGLRFIEQYDPEDESISSQPYAYVADTVVEVKLGVDVEEIRGFGLSEEKWTSILGLRDGLCQGHSPMPKLGWYVVVCGDEERLAPSVASSSDPTSSSVSDNHDGDDEEGEGEGDEEEEQEVEEEERVEEAVGLVAIAPSTTTNTSSQTPPAVPEPAAVKSSKVVSISPSSSRHLTSLTSSSRLLHRNALHQSLHPSANCSSSKRRQRQTSPANLAPASSDRLAGMTSHRSTIATESEVPC